MRARTREQAKQQDSLEWMARILIDHNPQVNRSTLADKLVELFTWATVEQCVAALKDADNEQEMLRQLGKAARSNPRLRSELLGFMGMARDTKDKAPTAIHKVVNGSVTMMFSESEDGANRYDPDATMDRVTAKSRDKVPRGYDPDNIRDDDGSENVRSVTPSTGFEE